MRPDRASGGGGGVSSVGAGSGRTARRGGRGGAGNGPAVREQEDDSCGPKSGVWGVDDRLTVQGPPPEVVPVEGFDEPVTEFASGGRRGCGRRRPPLGDDASPRDNSESTPRENLVMGFGGGREHNAVSAIGDDFASNSNNWGQLEAPPHQRPTHPAPSSGTWGLHEDSGTPEPREAPSQMKGGRRWWKPWQGGAGDAEGKQRGSAASEQSEVTQVCAFSLDD
mmetsp:Transcript_129303/g.335291  ORF Transcript_129303/g.335291 Transcript_129303/m.335291 type:complete len:223 (-) Transcript_129303:182-850(-)